MTAQQSVFQHILIRRGSAPAMEAALRKAEQLSHPGTLLHTLPTRSLQEEARRLPADLIIAGREKEHPLLQLIRPFPGRRLLSAGVPVLTVQPGLEGDAARTLIVPITGTPSQRRKEVLSTLCSGQRTRVHLVTFMDNAHAPSHFYASPLLQVYRWLRSSLHCRVEYAVLHGRDPARALFRYAEQVSAGMVLMPITSP